MSELGQSLPKSDVRVRSAFDLIATKSRYRGKRSYVLLVECYGLRKG